MVIDNPDVLEHSAIIGEGLVSTLAEPKGHCTNGGADGGSNSRHWRCCVSREP